MQRKKQHSLYRRKFDQKLFSKEISLFAYATACVLVTLLGMAKKTQNNININTCINAIGWH